MLTYNSQLLVNYIDQKLYPKKSKKKSHKKTDTVSLYKEYRDLYKFFKSIFYIVDNVQESLKNQNHY